MAILISRNRLPYQMAPPVGARPYLGTSLGQNFQEGWTAADGAGAAWSSISGRFPMTVHGSGPLWTPSPLGMAAKFDGSTNYVDGALAGLSGTFNPFQDFTVSLWFMTTNPTPRQVVIGDWDSSGTNGSFSIEIGGYLQTSTHITTSWASGGTSQPYIDSGVVAVANTWYHVATTLDLRTTTGTIYVNGAKKGTTSWSESPGYPTGTKTTFGRAGAFNTLYLSGAVGMPAIWNRALTPDEIWQLYASPFALFNAPNPNRWPGAAAGGGGGSSTARNFVVMIG